MTKEEEQEEEGKKIVSLADLAALYPKLHKKIAVAVADAEVACNGEDIGAVMENLGRLRRLLPPLASNSELLGFDSDDTDCDGDDDSCFEDPDSDPCCCDFPLPAFDEAVNFILLGVRF